MTNMNRLYDGAICWTGGRRAALRFETKTGFRKAPEGVAFTNPTSKREGLIPPMQQLNYRGPIIMGSTTDTSIMMLSMSLSLNVRMADTESPVLETSPTEIQYVGDGLVRVGRTIPEMITGEEEFVLLLSKDRTIWSRVANMTLVQAKNRWNPYTVFSVSDMGQTDRLSRLQTDYARVLTHKKAFLRPGYLRDRSIVVRINTNPQALDVFDERIQLTNARISDGMLYADSVRNTRDGEIALGTGWAQQFVGYRRLKDGLLRLSTVSHIVDEGNTVLASHLEDAKTLTGDSTLTVDTATGALREWVDQNTVDTEQELQAAQGILGDETVSMEQATDALEAWLDGTSVKAYQGSVLAFDATNGRLVGRASRVASSEFVVLHPTSENDYKNTELTFGIAPPPTVIDKVEDGGSAINIESPTDLESRNSATGVITLWSFSDPTHTLAKAYEDSAGTWTVDPEIVSTLEVGRITEDHATHDFQGGMTPSTLDQSFSGVIHTHETLVAFQNGKIKQYEATVSFSEYVDVPLGSKARIQDPTDNGSMLDGVVVRRSNNSDVVIRVDSEVIVNAGSTSITFEVSPVKTVVEAAGQTLFTYPENWAPSAESTSDTSVHRLERNGFVTLTLEGTDQSVTDTDIFRRTFSDVAIRPLTANKMCETSYSTTEKFRFEMSYRENGFQYVRSKIAHWIQTPATHNLDIFSLLWPSVSRSWQSWTVPSTFIGLLHDQGVEIETIIEELEAPLYDPHELRTITAYVDDVPSDGGLLMTIEDTLPEEVAAFKSSELYFPSIFDTEHSNGSSITTDKHILNITVDINEFPQNVSTDLLTVKIGSRKDRNARISTNFPILVSTANRRLHIPNNWNDGVHLTVYGSETKMNQIFSMNKRYSIQGTRGGSPYRVTATLSQNRKPNCFPNTLSVLSLSMRSRLLTIPTVTLGNHLMFI